MVLASFASMAGALSQSPGRSWRPVADTTADPVFAARKPKPYASIARGEDYYSEGALVWLEADQLIRNGTRGRKGLDDFVRAFFGSNDGDLGQRTYTFDDVVGALDAIYPFDWATFFRDRIDRPDQPAPVAGIERAGYRLVWRDEPNPADRARAADNRTLPLTFSLGLTLDKDGKVTASQWAGPAFNAGIVTGARIAGVNGAAYTPDAIRAAITAAKDGKSTIQLLVAIAYAGGLRYPWLEPRAAAQPTGLDFLLAPRVPR
jgi:predicted metalloprotease with PDZ domain